MRDPAGYMASAEKKFDQVTHDRLRSAYLRSFDLFDQIGGDVFEYGPAQSRVKLRAYLDAIGFPTNAVTEERLKAFAFRGAQKPELVTPQMQSRYDQFVSRLTAISTTFLSQQFHVGA